MKKVVVKTDSTNLTAQSNSLIIVGGFIWYKLSIGMARSLWFEGVQMFAVYRDTTESEIETLEEFGSFIEALEGKGNPFGVIGICLEGGYIDQALDLGTSEGDVNCITEFKG